MASKRNDWWINILDQSLGSTVSEDTKKQLHHIVELILEHERQQIAQWIERRK